MFGSGDLCKRNVDDIPSGIIASVDCKVMLSHAINDTPVQGWRSLDELEDPKDVELGDFVVHGDWIGQVSSKAQLYLCYNAKLSRR
jgi:ubiquitin-conjugating enzyme E2 O